MGTPFMGEIKLIPFNFPPKGWAFCNGQLLPINQNQALFSLLGTNYGGNGQTTFALPDLRGRAPIHTADSDYDFRVGAKGGASSHTLTLAEAGAHGHDVNYSNALATSANPAGALIGKKGRLGRDLFTVADNPSPTSTANTTPTGGNQPHSNMQPYLVLNAIIALQGIFPSTN